MDEKVRYRLLLPIYRRWDRSTAYMCNMSGRPYDRELQELRRAEWFRALDELYLLPAITGDWITASPEPVDYETLAFLRRF